jgi:uncharacterized membrane protein
MASEATPISPESSQPRTQPFDPGVSEPRSGIRPRRRNAPGMRSSTGNPLARSLGWFSIGLGAAQLLAPRAVSRLAGINAEHSGLMRLCGLREVTCGIGILTQPNPAPWVKARVAGDIADLAMLGLALVSPQNARGRSVAVLATVAGVTALDVMCSRELDRDAGSRGTLLYGVPVEKVVTVNRSPEECYGFWRKLENLPRFMRHLESVELLDERRSHWVAKAPAGMSVAWDAEVTEDRPNQLLAWRSLEGSDIPNTGTVRFEPAPPGRGTIVRVMLQYDPPAGPIGVAFAKLFGEEPQQQVNEDLRRFKQLLETGEIPTTAGQPTGRRSAFGRLFAKGDRA